MKKFLLFAAALTLFASCDNDFDLSDITADDIGIGSENSEFRLPLANISVLGDMLSSHKDDGTYAPLSDIFAEADIWLPTGYALDLEALANDADGKYLDGVIDDLFAELKTNDAKRRQVADLMATPQYSPAVHVPDVLAAQGVGVSDYIYGYMDNADYADDIRASVREAASVHLDSLNEVDPVESQFSGFDLDDDIIDVLAGEGSELKIYGTVFNALPISCTVQFVLSSNAGRTLVEFDDMTLASGGTADVETAVDGSDLRGMNGRMTLKVTFTPQTYYTGKDIPSASETALEMVLKLYKKGGMNLGEL